MNFVVVGGIWGAVTAYLWLSASSASLSGTIAGFALSLTPLLVVAMFFVRFSVVRGVAGGEGYDELT